MDETVSTNPDTNIPEIEDEEKNTLLWRHYKQFQHRYLVTIPKNFAAFNSFTDSSKCFYLPYPISSPVYVKNFDEYRNLFKPKPKLDSKMSYYRKLFLKDKLTQEHLKRKKIVELPQYIIDIVQNTEGTDSKIWAYTCGVLDTFYLNGKDYIVNTGFCQAPQIREAENCSMGLTLNIEDKLPIFSVKTSTEQGCVLIAMRHNYNTSVLRVHAEDDELQQDLLCRTTSSNVYLDISFNPMDDKEYATISHHHKLRILDLESCKVREKYEFDVVDSDTLSDSLAQIEFIDKNTVCFMNRSCIYFLDLRSRQTQKLSLKCNWMECDDLCCISRNNRNINCLYATSVHKLMHIDLRSLKQHLYVMHMLSSAPFITSVENKGFEDSICLAGQYINDRVIIRDNGTFSTPLYIPNNIDTLTKASLTNRITISECLEQRLHMPILGMKLHKDSKTDDMALYTSTAVGDIFKQKLTTSASDNLKSVDKLVQWFRTIPQSATKPLEITGICNLDKMTNTILHTFPIEKNLKRLVGDDVSQRFKRRCGDMSKYLQNSVGEAINAIWDNKSVDDADVQPPILTQSKVSDWLARAP